MKTKMIILGVIVALSTAATFKLKGNKKTVEANVYRPDSLKKVLVQAYKITAQRFDKVFSYTGTFAPYREVMLVPQVHGQVKRVYFNEGDVVREGKTLVQIDDDLLQAQYAAAEANYQTAKRNVDRYEGAAISGGVSKLQLDNFNLSLKTAESEVKQLAKQIELSRIEAPFTGTITLRDVEPGSIAGSTPVARITDLTQLKLEVSVPEKEILLFKQGETAAIATDIYPTERLIGKIEYVSARADNAHNYTVRILIRNNDSVKVLKAGMYGTVMIAKGLREDALLVPRAALLGSAKNPQVFVVENGRASLRKIQTGYSSNESIEVVEGLADGDEVITSGHINLNQGSNVEIVK